MKIAVCFSGMIRTGIQASSNIKKYIGELYPQTDFFMHTWDITVNKSWHKDSIMARKLGQMDYEPTMSYNQISELVSAYDSKFISIKIDNFNLWKTTFYQTHRHFSPLWHSFYESVNLKRQCEKFHSMKYDVVVKMRPDVIYPTDDNLSKEIEHFKENKESFLSMGYSERRIDDVFFLSNSDLMDNASEFINRIDSQVWKTNIFGEYMRKIGIPCKNTHSSAYAVFREEALNMNVDVDNFNLCFNIDRDYHAPYTVTDRFPI